jgi:hypothetical protein
VKILSEQPVGVLIGTALAGFSQLSRALSELNIDIGSNKRLGAVLEKIQADQRKRDEELLVKPRVTAS